MIKIITDYIYGVLVGNIPNDDDNFFAIDGDIIYDPQDDHFVMLFENGQKYKVTITRLPEQY